MNAKKLLVVGIILLFIGIAIVPSIASTERYNIEAVTGNNANDTKKWTFMFYDAADFPGTTKILSI